LLNFLKKKIGSWSDNVAQDTMEQVVRLFKTNSNREMANAFLATSLAANFLKKSRSLKTPFPDDLLQGDRIISGNEEVAALSQYLLELIRAQKQLVLQKNNMKLESMAAGIVSMQHSIKAVQRPAQLLPFGREMWRELMRGFSYMINTKEEDALEEIELMLSWIREINPAGGSELFYVPGVLVPDWKGLEHWEKTHAEGAARGG
jgi:hypothetical protein